ncbi:MAG TPA: branched-chain amino acid ABC transporter permease [Acetobacteraceae bacterium]|jgi:branched-chain amino acid transport system permease protein|nr:branched-chain amino acid ABC transporter permease [Acetobacteraceae bacterium]
MLALQLLATGLVTGCALGVVAISFALVYSTTKIFHVAHAGIYTLAGYLAWSLVVHNAPLIVAMAVSIVACTALGALIQSQLYARLERRRATHLVVLIASLGALAVIQNIIAGVYTPNILQFPLPWSGEVLPLGSVRLTYVQLLTIAVSFAAYAGTMWFAHHTILGKRIRAVASNPMLADITRLQPQSVYIYVIAIASALVCLPGILVPMDLGLQPYNGVTPLLTATIAMIAGGVGSITGAFVLSIAIAVLQNLSLLVMPGEWSIGVTFFIFVIFMLFRPTGLFAAAR